MQRREFIAGLGSAVAWPLAVRAQAERVRRLRNAVVINRKLDQRLCGQTMSG
jgi:hypothetical protein